MELIAIGLNHKTAPIEIREQLAFSEDRIENALSQLHSLSSLKEDMILSTCNRVEIYAIAREKEKAIFDLKSFLSQYHDLSLTKFEKNLYVFIEEEAVKHLFRVASSLDSMVIGEPQILGQLKSAYQFASRLKTSGIILHRLLHRAFHVAKRVRTETKIGNSAVSVSFVAVELAKKIFGTLEKRTILVIGAGEMCELAAQHLITSGAEKVLVTNRTYERAEALAQKFGGDAIPFEEIRQGLRRADIVISATNSPHYLLHHEDVSKVLRDRKQKPIFFIDIADPRDIEPRVGAIENVYLYNIDDLQKVAYDNIQDREKEAKKAEAIVQEEVIKFIHWYHSLEVTPTIVALRKKFEDIRNKELEKLFSIHPHFSDKERQSIEALTLSIINKILHDPLTLLKQRNEEVMSELYLDTLHTLFGLTVKTHELADEEQEKKD